MLLVTQDHFIRDVNKDNKLEVVLVETWCGAHTCGVTIHTIQFDVSGKKWRNLTPKATIELGERVEETIKWEDFDNDGSEELILHAAWYVLLVRACNENALIFTLIEMENTGLLRV